MNKKIATIDEYNKQFSGETLIILDKIRRIIRNLAPDAKESIKYGIPTFVFNGNLVHFAAYKTHIGFYPSPSGIDAYINELAKYRTGKGTIQFALSEPIPYDLIEKVVEFRIKENLNKGK